jgi:vacuolar protein sorting-associated protein 72
MADSALPDIPMPDAPPRHHDGPSEDEQSSDSSEPDEVPMVVTRERRVNAGNRMSKLLQLAGAEDSQNLEDYGEIFQEAADDVDFEADGVAEEDVNLDSSSDEDEDDDAQDEDQGERELKKVERAISNKRKRESHNLLHTSMKRAQARLVPRVLQASSPSSTTDTNAARPRKKSERVSWLPVVEEGPKRASSRQLSVQNKQAVHERLKEKEKHRLRTVAIMKAAEMRKEASKPKILTQAERLADAAATERMNSKSLNRWETAERKRQEEQAARLAALKNRKLEGPIISYWSGPSLWVNGKLKGIGKTALVEVVEEPKADATVKEPKVDTTVKEPKVDITVEETKVDITVNEPTVDTTANEPEDDATVNEPKVETAVIEPKADTTVNEPSQEIIPPPVSQPQSTPPSEKTQSQPAPAVEPSALSPPGIQSPAVQSPAVQPPAIQSPAIQSPAIQSSVVQSPGVQSSAVQSPAVQPPASLVPARLPIVNGHPQPSPGATTYGHTQKPSAPTSGYSHQFTPIPHGPVNFMDELQFLASLPPAQALLPEPRIPPKPTREIAARTLVELREFDPELKPKDKDAYMHYLCDWPTSLPKKLVPAKKTVCAVTGQPARYCDPVTGLPYSDSSALKGRSNNAIAAV